MARKSLLANSFLFLLAAVGCSNQQPLQYVQRADAQELPARHQQQLVQYLTGYFGTPARPRILAADAEVVAGSESGLPALADGISRETLRHGARVYRQRCSGCHGVTGDGNGPAAAWLNPKPRDYRLGEFKFTSTPRGSKPRRSDLVRIIRRGAKGTSMPAFPWLADEDLQPLIDYVMLLSQRGELEFNLVRESELELEEEDDYDPDVVADYVDRVARSWREADNKAVMPVTARPPYNDESILLGQQAFMSQGCAKCHGESGRGQTEWVSPRFLAEQQALPESDREQVNYDEWGNVAPAADLTAGMLHGGRRPLDIYRRIYSGINGTPMPAFGPEFSPVFRENPETIWHLVHYVLSIVEGRQAQSTPLAITFAAQASQLADSHSTQSPDRGVQP